MAEEEKYLLSMKNIVKQFPGVMALRGVDLNVRYGEVHSVIGENGAGKSTLVKCLIGIHQPTSGEIIFEGEPVVIKNTAEALEMGISMIHQELSPVEHRSIMENIWLGREPKNKFGLIDHRKMYDMTKSLLKRIELDEDPAKEVAELTVAKIQMLEIAKAISYNAKIVIMDEPTSSLTSREIETLFDIIQKLKENGTSIIFISHKLEEVAEISDRVSVYRDGNYVGTREAGHFDIPELISLMVGRELTDLFPKESCEIADVVLEVENLTSYGAFEDVSFTVRKGEIVGMSGLIGAGRTEVVEAIFGLRRIDKGVIKINGKPVTISSPVAALEHGLAFLTENRRLTGIFPMLSVSNNVVISSLKQCLGKMNLISHRKAYSFVDEFIDMLDIKTPSVHQSVENLSGGNQQKVLIARWLMTQPTILFLDEPTRGIDVGSKSEIHRLISDLVGEGKSVVMVSSELPEIMGMSDRIVVMHEGHVTGIVENHEDLTQDELMLYATGQKDQFKKLDEVS